MAGKNHALVSIGKGPIYTCEAHIEAREAPEDDQCYRRFLCSALGREYVPPAWPVLVVDNRKKAKRKVKLREESTTDAIYRLAVISAGSNKNDDFMCKFAKYLLDYYEKFGLLFNQKEISINEALIRLRYLFLFIPAYRSAAKETNRTWESELKDLLYLPYINAKKSHPEHTGNFIINDIKYSEAIGDLVYIAAPAKTGERGFVLPNKGPGDVGILAWCQNRVIENLNALLKRNFEYSVKFSERKRLVLTMNPTDLYTACVINHIKDDFISDIYQEELDRASWAKKNRRKALGLYRKWHERGKITDDEHKEILYYSQKLLPKDEEGTVYTMEEMREMINSHMEECGKSKNSKGNKKL